MYFNVVLPADRNFRPHWKTTRKCPTQILRYKKGLGLDLQTVKLFKKPQLAAQILFKESLNAEWHLQVFHYDIVDCVGGWMSEVSLTLAQTSVCRPGNRHRDEEKCTQGSGWNSCSILAQCILADGRNLTGDPLFGSPGCYYWTNLAFAHHRFFYCTACTVHLHVRDNHKAGIVSHINLYC